MLVGETSLERIMALFIGEENGNPHQYSCLENPMEEEPAGLQSMRLQRVGDD